MEAITKATNKHANITKVSHEFVLTVADSLFNETTLPKDNITLAAAHALADILTDTWRGYDVESYADLVDASDDVDVIYSRMGYIAINGQNTIDLESFNAEEASVLGKGSFGTVYEWNNVAVKVVPLLSDDEDPLYSSVLKEATALAMLSECKEVIDIYSCHFSNESYIVALQLCNTDLLAKYQPDQIQHKWLTSLMKGLVCIHSFDMVHGDIKPENLLICKGELVIADFGACVPYASKSKYSPFGTYNYLNYESLNYLVEMSEGKSVV